MMSTRLRLVVLGAALVTLLLAAFIWLGMKMAEKNRRIAALESELASSRRALETARTPVVAAPPVALPRPEPPAHTIVKEETPPGISAEVQELSAQLGEANAAMARLQGRINELETQVLNLSADRSRLTAVANEAQGQISELDRKLDEAAGEKSAREKRVRDLEAEVARLRALGVQSEQKGSQVAEMTKQLQDLSRRQQAYLTNILRRYREVTDLLRTLPSGGDMTRGGGGNGPEVARIQTAIAMADEDLRQLNELNLRLGRVQKEIASAAR
jgi:DNA repair exonuclease SbcCD ATPase subunit